jgi:predicted O-methyltransferase YrrM
MLSGHLQGRLLALLSTLVKPKRVLEIGTFTGYATLCLAEGLPPEGKIITIEVNEELEKRLHRYFKAAGYHPQIDLRIGNAMQVIDTLEETFDLVFIDADKKNYLHYYQKIMPKVKIGGLVIADNVLWSGKVTTPIEQMDKDTQAIHLFNDFVKNDTSVEQILLPIRDGLYLIKKIG